MAEQGGNHGQRHGGYHGRTRTRTPSNDVRPPMPDTYHLSTITLQQLEALYGVTYEKVMVDHRQLPTASFHSLRDNLMVYDYHSGDSERPQKLTWKCITELYSMLFSDVTPALPPNLPPRLAPLLHFLSAAKTEGVNVFSNGAGKLFMMKILELLPIGPWVRAGTTRNSRTDWCGITGARLCGVVDVAIVRNGTWLVVGEVKGDYTTAVTQILAAMQAAAECHGDWPYGEVFCCFC